VAIRVGDRAADANDPGRRLQTDVIGRRPDLGEERGRVDTIEARDAVELVVRDAEECARGLADERRLGASREAAQRVVLLVLLNDVPVEVGGECLARAVEPIEVGDHDRPSNRRGPHGVGAIGAPRVHERQAGRDASGIAAGRQSSEPIVRKVGDLTVGIDDTHDAVVGAVEHEGGLVPGRISLPHGHEVFGIQPVDLRDAKHAA